MRRLAGWVLVLAGVAVSADAQVARPSFSIALSASQPSFEVGKPMLVHLVVTALSDEEISAPAPYRPEFYYQIYVRRSDGRQTPATAYGLQVRQHAIGLIMNVLKTMRRGETIEQDMDLTKIYEITRPGSYEVQFSRQDCLDPTRTIFSPVLRVEIAAAQ